MGEPPPRAADAAARLDEALTELGAIREVMRRRTRLLAWLIAAVLLAALAVSAGGVAYSRSVFCQFFLDLQPAAGEPAPAGEYGRRILRDARTTADRLWC